MTPYDPWIDQKRNEHRPYFGWLKVGGLKQEAQTLHGTAIYADQLYPFSTTPGLIGSPMAVPCVVFGKERITLEVTDGPCAGLRGCGPPRMRCSQRQASRGAVHRKHRAFQDMSQALTRRA